MALGRLGMALARDGIAWHRPVQIPISRSAVRRVDEFKHGFAVVPAGGAPVVLQVSTHRGTHSPGTHSRGTHCRAAGEYSRGYSLTGYSLTGYPH